MGIKLIPHQPDRIIALDIDGWIDAEDMERITKSLETRLKQGEKLRIYVEVHNWSGMSLGALIQDLKFSLQHLQDFDKEAIVSDRRWLEGLAAVGNSLFSGVEVKHFTFDETDKALQWVSL